MQPWGTYTVLWGSRIYCLLLLSDVWDRKTPQVHSVNMWRQLSSEVCDSLSVLCLTQFLNGSLCEQPYFFCKIISRAKCCLWLGWRRQDKALKGGSFTGWCAWDIMNILISLWLRCLSLLISTTLPYLRIVDFLDEFGQTNAFLLLSACYWSALPLSPFKASQLTRWKGHTGGPQLFD